MNALSKILDTISNEIGKGVAKLREKSPDHPLLRYAEPALGRDRWSNDLQGQFYREFNPTGRLGAITPRRAYINAIQGALSH